jgi:hypothetical protein
MGGTTRVNVFREYGLSLVLALFFVLSWLVQTIAGWVEFVAEQTTHGETPAVFGDSGYVWPWLQATFENWQSEFLQLVWQAVGLALLFLWGSSQSKESDERLEAKIDRLLEEQGVDPDDITRQVNQSL